MRFPFNENAAPRLTACRRGRGKAGSGRKRKGGKSGVRELFGKRKVNGAGQDEVRALFCGSSIRRSTACRAAGSGSARRRWMTSAERMPLWDRCLTWYAHTKPLAFSGSPSNRRVDSTSIRVDDTMFTDINRHVNPGWPAIYTSAVGGWCVFLLGHSGESTGRTILSVSS